MIRSSTVRRLALAPILVLASAALAACGGDEEPAEEQTAAVQAVSSTSALPAEMLGLTVAPENVEEQVNGAKNTYVDKVGFFSFRREDMLQATLQVGHLRDDVDATDEDFRSVVVTGIATSTPQELRMGDDTVWLSSSLRQNVAIWFDDENFYVLSSREEFEGPRALVRALLDMEIKL